MRLLLAALLVGLAAAEPTAGYRLEKTVAIPGDGSWDYVAVDEAARRVYVSHGTEVVVLDADSGELKGSIPETKGVHGIAVAPELGWGFISNGKADTVTIFDLKTLKRRTDVPAGKNPDAIVYEPVSRQAIAFNGGSANATLIDATGKVAATLELGGRPEFAVADGTGHVFVNLLDKHQLLKLDARKPEVVERWPLAPGESPASLAMDRHNRRLFVGCRNQWLVVVNADTGQVVDKQPVGERVDATAYDAEARLVISSNGDGTLTVVRQDGPDKYSVTETVKTRAGSKTCALDPKTHRLFVPAAEFKPAPPATPENPRPRPVMVPGSFVVLIYGKD